MLGCCTTTSASISSRRCSRFCFACFVSHSTMVFVDWPSLSQLRILFDLPFRVFRFAIRIRFRIRTYSHRVWFGQYALCCCCSLFSSIRRARRRSPPEWSWRSDSRAPSTKSVFRKSFVLVFFVHKPKKPYVRSNRPETQTSKGGARDSLWVDKRRARCAGAVGRPHSPRLRVGMAAIGVERARERLAGNEIGTGFVIPNWFCVCVDWWRYYSSVRLVSWRPSWLFQQKKKCWMMWDNDDRLSLRCYWQRNKRKAKGVGFISHKKTRLLNDYLNVNRCTT